jgi:1,2-diacylglycerol-3-alpha-glucose alpha-1,2-galactosyltransferase
MYLTTVQACSKRDFMLRVVVFSESAITFDGHGVHTAFIECRNLLHRAANVQVVNPWELRPSDILHVHSAGPAALALLISHPGPKVVSAHLTAESFLGSIRYACQFKSAIERYLKLFYEQADLILAVSESTKRYLKEQLRVSKPIEVSPNTIDRTVISKLRARRNELRVKLNWSQRPVILGVGQIQPRKGVDEFVAVARAMPAADFVWVGGFLFGPLSADRDRLQRLIRLAPRNLLFAGKLERESLYNYYVAADIFLLPSHQETFGLAILEAAIAGLPLVVRDLPSYRSIFGDAYIAVADDDYQSAITSLLDDRELLASYSKKALVAADSYSSDKYTDNIITLYMLAKRLRRA